MPTGWHPGFPSYGLNHLTDVRPLAPRRGAGSPTLLDSTVAPQLSLAQYESSPRLVLHRPTMQNGRTKAVFGDETMARWLRKQDLVPSCDCICDCCTLGKKVPGCPGIVFHHGFEVEYVPARNSDEQSQRGYGSIRIVPALV